MHRDISGSHLEEMSGDDMNKSHNKQQKQKDGEGNFLSRLFGSKRLKLRTSVSKKDLTEEKRKPAANVNVSSSPPSTSPSSPPTHSPTANTFSNISSKSPSIPASKSPPNSSSRSPPYSQSSYPHFQEQFVPHPDDLKPRHKQKPPPPPPPDTVPPPDLHHYVPQQDHYKYHHSSSNQVQVLPPLPSNKSDIILKKNTSLAALPYNPEENKFHASVQNWSYANEGRIRSMVSLSDAVASNNNPAKDQSNESLATISSLLEEPELLEHTSIDTSESVEETEKLWPQNNSQNRPESVTEECVVDQDELTSAGASTDDDGDEISPDNDIAATEEAFVDNKHDDASVECVPANITENNETPGDDQSAENELITKPTDDDEHNAEPISEQINKDKEMCVGGDKEGYTMSAAPYLVSNIKGVSLAGGLKAPTINSENEFKESGKLSNNFSEKSRNLCTNMKGETLLINSNNVPQDDVVAKLDKDRDGHETDTDLNQDTKEDLIQPLNNELKSSGNDDKRNVDNKQPNAKSEENRAAATEENVTHATTINRTPSKTDLLMLKKKPEISPKPVPAPRTFFMKQQKAETVTTVGVSNHNDDSTNELLAVFAKRSNSSSDVLEAAANTVNAETAKTDSNQAGDIIEKESDEGKPEVEINVKERAKSFSGLQHFPLGPRPFIRPVSISSETEKQKPKLATKPVPAPRQFRSFSKLEQPEKTLKTTKSTPLLHHCVVTEKKTVEVEIKETPPSSVVEDQYNLDDIQVKKIADKFQKQTPPKPERKTAPVSPSKQLEDENNAKKNVLNMVTKINSMTVL